MKRRRGFSVVRLQDVLLEHHNDVSKGRNNDFPLVYNETPNDVSVVRYLDISKVCIHDVPLARLYDISCKFQIKQPKGLLWYVSITPRSYVFARSCQQVFPTHSNYIVITSIWWVSRSYLSIKSSTKFFQYQPGGKQKELFGL